MPKKLKAKTYDEAVSWFRANEFEVMETPGVSGRVFLKKYSVSAAIERAADGGVKILAYPGCLIGGEISKVVDYGNQKVLKTSKTELAATAEHLRALHQFAEELKVGNGGVSLYNESLGTVSSEYNYDRLRGRDLSADKRTKRSSEKTPA